MELIVETFEGDMDNLIQFEIDECLIEDSVGISEEVKMA